MSLTAIISNFDCQFLRLEHFDRKRQSQLMHFSLPDSLYVQLIAAFLRHAYDFTNIIMPEYYGITLYYKHVIFRLYLMVG